jgi:predicted ATPase
LAHALKGIEGPVKIYRVIRPSGMRGRFEAAVAAGRLTRFVGREDELRLLMSRWERVREGAGQVVTITGEAGIGKSRLVRRLHEDIIGTPHTWLEAGAAAVFQNTPFYATSDMLQESFHWNADETIERRLAALESSLARSGIAPYEGISLIAPLLGLPLAAPYSPLPMVTILSSYKYEGF